MKALWSRSTASLLAVGLFSISGCAYAIESPCSGSECDVPDPITLDAPLVRCWMEAGRTSETELHCSYAPSEALPVRIASSEIQITSTDGTASLSLDEPGEDFLLARFDNEDFPVELAVELVYAEQSEQVIGIDTLEHNTRLFHFEDAQAANDAKAAEVRLPFSLWEVTLHNRYQRSVRLRFRHGLPFEPAGHIAEADIDCNDFGYQSTKFLAVPKDADTLDAALRVDDQVRVVDLDGPGSYQVDEDGSFSKIGITATQGGHNTADCWIEAGTSKAYRLTCAAAQHPGLSAVTVDLRSANGEFAVLPLATGTATRELDLEAFPLELSVRTTLDANIYGLRSFADSPHRQVLRITRPQDANKDNALSAHLPFDLWRLEVVADSNLRDLGIEFQPFDLELGSPWLERFAVRTFRRPMLGLAPGQVSEAIVAVSPGQRGIPVSAYVVDERGQRHQEEFLLGNHRYRASALGVSKSPQ